MDEQVKARLIGATVLVVIAVALVPELLSGPKHVATTGSPVEPNRATRTVTIDLGGAVAGASKVPVAPAATEPVTREPVPLPSVTVPGAAAETGAGIEPSAESSDPPEDVAIIEPLPTPAPTVASNKTAGSSTAPSATPRPAAEASHPPATATSAGQGGWSVQVGAFGSADAARKVVGELKKDGLAAYVAPLNRDGKTLHRVRVGPASSKAEAEKLATRLKAKGLAGSIVPPQ